jgi:hypothetical protein
MVRIGGSGLWRAVMSISPRYDQYAGAWDTSVKLDVNGTEAGQSRPTTRQPTRSFHHRAMPATIPLAHSTTGQCDASLQPSHSTHHDRAGRSFHPAIAPLRLVFSTKRPMVWCVQLRPDGVEGACRERRARPPALAAERTQATTKQRRLPSGMFLELTMIQSLAVRGPWLWVGYFHERKAGVDRVFVDHPLFLGKVWGFF